jgi:hypothetical protein
MMEILSKMKELLKGMKHLLSNMTKKEAVNELMTRLKTQEPLSDSEIEHFKEIAWELVENYN